MTILFKEQGSATRVSVRTKPGGVDATVLTGIFGGGGHARAAGATVDLPLRPRRSASCPRPAGSRPRSSGERGDADTGPVPTGRGVRRPRRRVPRGPGSTGCSSWPSRPGPTSHDIVALVRRLAATKRVGHGGTLDPFATGVLPVFLGRATRLVEFHLGDRKGYRATVCFGASSTTDDLDGELTPVGRSGARPRPPSSAALAALVGPISQVPPAFSAIKVGGPAGVRPGPLGGAAEPSPRARSRSTGSTSSTGTASDPDRPIAVLEVECSAGTYVRAIARDSGWPSGARPTSGALTRTASGGFALEAAHPLDDDPRGGRVRPGRAPAAAPADRRRPRAPAAGRARRVRRSRRSPGASSSDRPAACPASIPPGDPIIAVDETRARRRRGPRSAAGRLAPDKVLVDAPAPDGSPSGRGATPEPSRARYGRWTSSTGSTALTARARPPVRRRRRVRRPPPRPPLPARPAAPRGGPSRRPGRP